MDVAKGMLKEKNFFIKTWEKCQSIRRGDHVKSPSHDSRKFSKNKSSHGGGCVKSPSHASSIFSKSKSCRGQIAPEGCFSVYVGPERQRFVIKAKRANHPLFKMVLEDAEMEYGYNCEGPLLIPCEVDLFYKVLAEMDGNKALPNCGFVYGSCSPFGPSPRLGKSNMGLGCGSFGLLTQSQLVKMNQF